MMIRTQGTCDGIDDPESDGLASLLDDDLDGGEGDGMGWQRMKCLV